MTLRKDPKDQLGTKPALPLWMDILVVAVYGAVIVGFVAVTVALVLV